MNYIVNFFYRLLFTAAALWTLCEDGRERYGWFRAWRWFKTDIREIWCKDLMEKRYYRVMLSGYTDTRPVTQKQYWMWYYFDKE